MTDALKQELGGIRTNRPSPQLIENIQVDFLGQALALKQMGSISVVPPRELQVAVWDKSSVSTVAKAIEQSPLRLIPSVEGNVIHVRFPSLTEERRAELMKVAKSSAEKIRIKIRGARDEVNKRIAAAEQAKTISEDQKFKTKDRVQKLIDKANADIEVVLTAKIKEISE